MKLILNDYFTLKHFRVLENTGNICFFGTVFGKKLERIMEKYIVFIYLIVIVLLLPSGPFSKITGTLSKHAMVNTRGWSLIFDNKAWCMGSDAS